MSTDSAARNSLIGRWLITIATLAYAFAPPFFDLNKSHVFNPGWPAHARTHLVWMLVTSAFIGLVVLYLVWFQRGDRRLSIDIATILGGCVFVGFFVSVAAMSYYDGGLSENTDTPFWKELNFVAFSIAFALLLVGFFLARRKDD